MTETLLQMLETTTPPSILVVGDLMLDKYVWGNIDRVAPEAPIRVLDVQNENEMLGGAANVAAKIAELGARVIVGGVVGTDIEGKAIIAKLDEKGVDTSLVIVDDERPTTVKTRFVTHNQHVVRVDRESRDDVSGEIETKLLDGVRKHAAQTDLVLLSDYAKGVLTPPLVKKITALAAENNIVVGADPKSDKISKYKGMDFITPNRSEAAALSGIPVDTKEDAVSAAKKLLAATGGRAVIVTLDKDGAMVLADQGNAYFSSAKAKMVYDVTGAGDTFIAVFSYIYAGTKELAQALEIANFAAGLKVSKVGTASINKDELAHFIDESRYSLTEKLRSLEQLTKITARLREEGKKVVFTNGCFDICHFGHMKLLEDCKKFGDVLIVGLNTDASVRKLKGEGRPIQSEQERAHFLGANVYVDYVVLFDDDTPLNLIETLRPDVLVKGADYTVETVVGHELVEKYGGRVELVPIIEGFSTSDLIAKILDRYGKQPG